MPNRRTGDLVSIAGAYQYEALVHGPVIQRHWHFSKLLLVDALVSPTAGDRILDVGCGSGVVAAHMASAGAHVTGIDGNSSAIDFASSQFASHSSRVSFRHGLVDELRLQPAHYDKAICFEVIEHLYRPQAQAMLAAIVDALTPGGFFLVTTPNYHSAWPVIEFSLDLFGLVPKLKGDQHVCKYTHASLGELCTSAGLSLVKERSVCTLGPWLAPLSNRLACAATRLELNHRLSFGTILAHLYRRS